MTVSTTSNRIVYTGNGSTTAFAFPYKFIATADLKVYVAGVLQTTGYTVGTPSDTGANVTFSVAPANGAAIILLSDPARLQSTALPSTGPFPAKSVETMADKLTLLVQRLYDLASRSLTLNDADSTTAGTTLPTPAASNIIGWNSTGTGLQNVPLADLATSIAYGTARSDVFVGDGTTKTFMLSANPGAQANLDVSIAGVAQLPGTDYTWSTGTSLVFSSEPPLGAKILARYMQGLAQGASDSGSASFIQSGTGTVQRTAQDKMQEFKSLTDFAGSDDDTRFTNAKANGTKWLRIPQGDHTITGWSIAETDSLVGLIFEPGARLLVTAASNRIGLDIQKTWFKIIGEVWIESTGTATDGLATVGIRHGHPTLGGKAYCEIDRIRYANFSSRGVVSYQPVYLGIGSIIGTGASGSSMYGFTVDQATIAGIGTVPGTTVQVGRCYITGALRGIYLNGAGWVELDMPVLEYCGSSSSTDGALHLVNVAQCVIKNIYGEQNARNIVRVDSTPVFIGGAMFTATAADSATYSGVAFAQRGVIQLRNNTINARKIDYDTNDNADLTIGTNLTVPAAGGSVAFGSETMLSATGTLTSATWTTVYTIPTNDMSGGGNQRALYEYICYAGAADLTTGFDAGTIMNGTMRSYTGALPAWLRISGNTVQMNVTNSSYGLNFKIVLRRVFPGN